MPFPPMTESAELLYHEAFDDDTKRAVVDAFNGAWLMMLAYGDPLANTERYPEVRALLACRIINAARMGMKNTIELRLEGLRYIRTTLTDQWPKEN
jgi:hypothetical protein